MMTQCANGLSNQGAEHTRLCGLPLSLLSTELAVHGILPGKKSSKSTLVDHLLQQFVQFNKLGKPADPASGDTGKCGKSKTATAASTSSSTGKSGKGKSVLLPGESAAAAAGVGVDITSAQFTKQGSTSSASCEDDVDVMVPDWAVSKFRDFAEDEFLKGVRRFGVFLGRRTRIPKLKRDVWLVEALFLPAQVGTIDSCEVTDEHDASMLTRICSQHDWNQIGWVVTHPLRPMDLTAGDHHTQYMLQAEFKDAFAGVINTTDAIRYFRLSDYGMGFVEKCVIEQDVASHVHPRTGMTVDVSVAGDPRRRGYVFDEEAHALPARPRTWQKSHLALACASPSNTVMLLAYVRI